MTPVCSIVIPTFNHAHVLPDAIESALAQTVPCEIIVVDDGSTDDTAKALRPYGERLAWVLRTPNHGPASARNVGIAHASGEYLMFLDADDLIAPSKVARQIAELEANNDAGWCFCDTRIVDAISGKDETASKRYGYAGMRLDGDISPLLAERNFIPVHAPLIWRPALEDIRFHDGPLEDWAFWRALAAVAGVRYVPQVLCTYRAGKGGRNRAAKGESWPDVIAARQHDQPGGGAT